MMLFWKKKNPYSSLNGTVQKKKILKSKIEPTEPHKQICLIQTPQTQTHWCRLQVASTATVKAPSVQVTVETPCFDSSLSHLSLFLHPTPSVIHAQSQYCSLYIWLWQLTFIFAGDAWYRFHLSVLLWACTQSTIMLTSELMFGQYLGTLKHTFVGYLLLAFGFKLCCSFDKMFAISNTKHVRSEERRVGKEC